MVHSLDRTVCFGGHRSFCAPGKTLGQLTEELTTHGAETTSYLHLDVRFKGVSAIRGRNDLISLFRRIFPTRSGSGK